jgi:2-polyprenyl-3-methyl-5-hydroxy-6-metoxy-1,4-benzoquinol methylase
VNRWKDKNYKSFLDLGCGLGRHSLLFAQSGFKVSSFDLSEEAVTNVRKRSIELG